MSTKSITESNELINAEAKLVLEKIEVLHKTRTETKTGIENSTGNADKKSMAS